MRDGQMTADGLLSPARLGAVELRNRVVMASMTRARVEEPDLVPGALQAAYYAQRASAGLLMSEGIWVSRQAIGFTGCPGLFTDRQAEGWRTVTDAVHARSGVIFAQLGHAGAASHPDLLDGEVPAGPSPIDPRLRVFTPGGFKDTVRPREMTPDDIARTIADYESAARRARTAGFDGVELHAANTYLLPQFFHPGLNRRSDRYGGGAFNRSRLAIEILEALIGVFGAGRVGIKIGPATAIGPLAPDEDTIETYDRLVSSLAALPLSHVQIVRPPTGTTMLPRALLDPLGTFCPRVRAVVMANGGFDRRTGEQAVRDGVASLVAFAKPFIANPDLVRRFASGARLASTDPATIYGGSVAGYTDYPALDGADGPLLDPQHPNKGPTMTKETAPATVSAMKVLGPDEGLPFDVAGCRLTWKIRGEDSDRAFTMSEQVLDRGGATPPHHHPYAEVFRVLVGSVAFTCHTADGPVTKICGVGETIIFPPDVVHAFVNAGEHPAHLLGVSTYQHQLFFDAVASADGERPFKDMPLQDAMQIIAGIGQSTQMHFVV